MISAAHSPSLRMSRKPPKKALLHRGWVPAVLGALVACSVLLCGCAKPPREAAAPTGAGVERVWITLTAPSAPQARGFLFKSSLNSITPQGVNRLTFDLWGNFEYPVRLDVRAGIGATIALWREGATGWLAYYPGQNVTYLGAADHLAEPDIQRLPLSLRELALLLSGRIGAVLPAGYSDWTLGEQGGIRYLFNQGERLSELALDSSLRPLMLTGSHPEPWSLSFDSWDDAYDPIRPVKMTLRFQKDSRHILRVKQAEFRDREWDRDALSLTPPEDSRVIDIEALPGTDFFLAPS